jgi:hypothetical protein
MRNPWHNDEYDAREIGSNILNIAGYRGDIAPVPIRILLQENRRGLLGLEEMPLLSREKLSERLTTLAIQSEYCTISFHIEEAMPADIESDDFFFLFLLTLERLINSASHAVGGFGSRQEPFGLEE